MRHITIASNKVISLKLSRALTNIRSNCLISWSVILLLMHPNTISARGCKAGLKQNAKLFAKDVQVRNQSQLGISRIQASIISSKASVITSKLVKESLSRSCVAQILRSLPNHLSVEWR